MPAEPADKAKALLKFGTQALWDMRLKEAETALRQAADGAKAAKQFRLQARALARLHTALAYQGRAGEAYPLLSDAMNERFKLQDDEVALLVIQSCLLRLLPPSEKVAELIRDFVLGAAKYSQDPDVARALGQVAIVCNNLGDPRAALQLLERALPVVEATGATSPEFALMLANLADLRGTLEGYRNFDKIEPLFRRAIAIQDVALPPNHPERVAPLLTIGTLLGRSARYDEARALLQRALAIATEIEGAEGQTPQVARSALAELDVQLLDPKAETHLKKKVVEAAAKAVALELATRLTALCRHYFARHKPREAEPHYRKLREIAGTLGETEQRALAAEMGVPEKIYVLLQQDKGDLAEKLLLGELATMERVLPKNHEEILDRMYFIGNVYRMTKRHKESLGMFERYVAGVRTLGSSQPALADGLRRALDAQLWLGRKKEAERIAEEIEGLTGKRPHLDPALNEFERQLRSVWHVLGLKSAPDVIGAALGGNADAGLVVGLCFAAGQGSPPDMQRALPWFDAAAKAGHPIGLKIAEALRAHQPINFDMQLIATAAQMWVEKSAGRLSDM